ncbi:adenine nucleotide alpha hydrolase [Spirochaetia bacterium]|nr:adenine nucleotide alpha hydrolase [Spirochaetia bacterium]GHU31145.1 adenine nucleotide alpha hydrolase [Spirochaetia bacterium]
MSDQTQTLDEKYNCLLRLIAETGGAVVAFSGGVDSSFLCHAAVAALGRRSLAITIVSPMLPESEIECARDIARITGIEHLLIEENEIEDDVSQNNPQRCYYCKKREFGAIQKAARERGVEIVLDGSNLDDMGDYRPGLKALTELGIKSPLREAGLTKQDIRDLSHRFNLPTWDKPAFACLASRIPYGETITAEKLSRIEKAEVVLREAGFRQFRVRSHGDIARIEAAPEERRLFFSEAILDSLSEKIKACGFLYAAFELEGYRMGSLNRAIGKEKNNENAIF